MVSLTEVAYRWYTAMSQVSAALSGPLQQAMGSQNIPGISAFLLGLLGGLAPCQVTANAGAIAYVTQAEQGHRSHWRTVWAYLSGKGAVYLAFGFLAAMLGFRIPTPFLGLMRKLTGPLMLVIALHFAGAFRWSGGTGARITEWMRRRIPRRGSPAFWMGIAFSLGFCPTMVLIFFGALVPLILRSPAGLVLALVFTVGTGVPVILWATALSVGKRTAGQFVTRLRSADRYIKWAAAAVLLAVGLNDTLLYWFM